MNIMISFDQIFLILGYIIALISAAHVIIYKSNYRSALGWLVFIAFFPLWGSILYLIFGINRIPRKALKINQDFSIFSKTSSSSITPLMSGNIIYQTMFDAMANARKSIDLMTYIFDDDRLGKLFIKQLVLAKNRGVIVRVLIDDFGSKGNSGIFSELNIQRINCLRFNTLNLLFRANYLNLRSHRKLLIIDDQIVFTGGANISERYDSKYFKEKATSDLHFMIKGKCVGQFKQVFVADWNFTKGIDTPLNKVNNSNASNNDSSQSFKVLPLGPSKTSLNIPWHLINIINNSKSIIRIMTPYFLPSTSVTTALINATLRGVKVQIIIPKVSDHLYANWATMGILRPFLEFHCEIYFTNPPFNHSKLLIIDNELLIAGSSNWDHRSFRLNFELNFESSDKDLIDKMNHYIDSFLKNSNQYDQKQYKQRNFLRKILHGTARLASPYL